MHSALPLTLPFATIENLIIRLTVSQGRPYGPAQPLKEFVELGAGWKLVGSCGQSLSNSVQVGNWLEVVGGVKELGIRT